MLDLCTDYMPQTRIVFKLSKKKKKKQDGGVDMPQNSI